MASVRSEALALDYRAKAMGFTAHALQAAMKYRKKHLNVVDRVSSGGSHRSFRSVTSVTAATRRLC